jgi:hypothetical protein
MDTVTIPRPVYDALLVQARANAKALELVLQTVKAKERVQIPEVKLYRALTGVGLMMSRHELSEWLHSGR